MSNNNWVGYAVSVNCGEPLGCYQGTILEADGSTITLTKAFRNGFPYPKSQVTLNAADIKELKIIEARAERPEQHSTVAVSKGKKGARATVCETLQANPSSSGNQAGNVSATGKANRAAPARSKPIDIQGSRPNKNVPHTGSYGNSGTTPKGRGAGGHDKARRRNEACFGDAAHPALADDFDFESNLALFDKRALWEQMRNSHKPDLVRHADDAGKFRHDENVLGDAGQRRALRVPDALRGEVEYVTDDGVRVPSLAAAPRRRLWAALRRLAPAPQVCALLARAAADVALRLVGGERRLDPRNAHQTPYAVALCGAHGVGAAGVMAARLLAAHGARAFVLAPAHAACEALVHELAAAAACGVRVVHAPDALPSADLVLLALHDAEEAGAEAAAPAAEAALRWARSARAALVALEPPVAGWPGVSARAAVQALLPSALAPALGRVYLANVAPPLAAFAELAISYRPPFGASSVLALHAQDD